ncbi:unnamed protein product [Rotaria sordida]|uniref:Tyrosine-protein phosphatase domain-containing protein n=1 Tax=Rotaria sordida TaxID=392033 RepID=A0A814BD33_9BILA|nr:unnamed protein product [Rotaria sordida]
MLCLSDFTNHPTKAGGWRLSGLDHGVEDPDEHSRVKLIPVDECDPGYINCNFISGLHNPREYIACQGPLKSTINDHWKMIWEQNVMIIVMLTGLIERGMLLKVDQKF